LVKSKRGRRGTSEGNIRAKKKELGKKGKEIDKPRGEKGRSEVAGRGLHFRRKKGYCTLKGACVRELKSHNTV